jgi:uncharacterized protein YndB with AHSA1/START domain
MESKTKVNASNGSQVVTITREFDLPVNLLFKAYVEADIISQWMGTKVVKLESRKHGSYQYETSDQKGNVVFRASGVIHDIVPDSKITRTFEMENTPFGVQLEFYEFESLTDDTSRLNMHVVYETVSQRDEVMKLPFVRGISWAHDRIQEIASKLK